MASGIQASQAAAAGSRAPRPSLLYMAKQLELVIRARLDEMLRDSGITSAQYTALTVLDSHDGLSPAQLARNSFVTPQATADLLASLERRNLVRRDRNPDNRRELQVTLTSEGRAFLRRYAEDVAALEERMTLDLDADEVGAFRRYLDACRLALGGPA